MSRTKLHELLQRVFDSKDLLTELPVHEDYRRFLQRHNLSIPQSELVTVFTHKSFSHEFSVPHQEQLEFLGDAVLQLILTDELYRRFSTEKEGHLSKLRSAIVNEESLASLARGLSLGELILVGRGEFKKGLVEQDPVLADTFEALLAQIYRFHGLEFTKELFLGWLKVFMPAAFESNFLDHFDAKSRLQELVLGKFKKLPRYTSETRGDKFEIGLWVNEELLASGVFTSKKLGEKELAKLVLKKEII